MKKRILNRCLYHRQAMTLDASDGWLQVYAISIQLTICIDVGQIVLLSDLLFVHNQATVIGQSPHLRPHLRE